MGFEEQSGILKGETPDGDVENIQLTKQKELITDNFQTNDLLKGIETQLKILCTILNEVHDLKVGEEGITDK